ncbi:MAG: hypothetical protein OER86_00125 [Phycisphaerae bacterium]|nr:hypothetical protein [Phycisphaerae bacterium]
MSRSKNGGCTRLGNPGLGHVVSLSGGKSRTWLVGLVLGSVLGSATAGARGQQEGGPAIAERSIKPPDVFVLVGRVHNELKLIRTEMGRPGASRPLISVSGAAPREVYYQALTLFAKADRLALELTRERGQRPKPPEGKLTPVHVYAAVKAALDQVQRCKKELGIREQAASPARDATKTPTDVFRAIIEANRQLNALLDRRFAPADVYQQVTVAISYTANLLATFPGATRIPEAPVMERGKEPADVHRRLVGCFERVRRIAARSGVTVLKLGTNTDGQARVAPADVYDIATLLVSELAHLHARRATGKEPIEPYYPGRKFPSHVYQRAGILEAQLIDLEKQVEAAPDWLGGSSSAGG